MKIPKDIAVRVSFKKPNNHTPEAQQFPYVESVNPIESTCEDCDTVVVDRRIEYRLTKQGWNTRCTNCGKYRHPITGEFSFENWRDISNFLRSFNKDNK
jgi:hypothetical protein